MDSEVRALIEEIGDNYHELKTNLQKRAEEAAKGAYEKRVSTLESRLEVMATFGGGAPGTGAEQKFWLPSGPEFKAQAISSEPGGGYLVPDQNADLFFDRLRPQSVVLAAGPVRYAMKTDAEEIPKLGSSVTVYNPGEGNPITASDLQFATVRLASRKYTTRTIASSEWLDDSNPSGRQLVQRDHERSIVAAIDRDCLEGNGAGNRILGIRNTPSANTTTLGSGSGAVVTLDDVLAALGRLEANDAEGSALFMHPRTWQQLREERDVANGRYMLQPDPSSETVRRVFGVPVFISSQISTTESPGGGDSSYILAVDMSRVVVGVRREIRVLFDPYSLSANDQIVLVTTSRWALAVMDADAVEIIAGCQP
jgi:HK97 family phage major capsid protein